MHYITDVNGDFFSFCFFFFASAWFSVHFAYITTNEARETKKHGGYEIIT
jgi:hypothetical protein